MFELEVQFLLKPCKFLLTGFAGTRGLKIKAGLIGLFITVIEIARQCQVNRLGGMDQ